MPPLQRSPSHWDPVPTRLSLGVVSEIVHEPAPSGRQPRNLAPGQVHIWYHATATAGELELERALALLSPDERAQHDRFIFARDRRDYAMAHALVRRALSRYAGVAPEEWRFQPAPGGKPFLMPIRDAASLSFSLSHTHGLVACAIADQADIGIDVEAVRGPMDDLLNQVLSTTEIHDVRRSASPLDQGRRFCELWTLKEAFTKATGEGLSRDVRQIAFAVDEDQRIIFKPAVEVDPNSWRFGLFAPTPEHFLAIAVRSQPGSLTSMVFNASNGA